MRSTPFFAFILIAALTSPAFAQAPPSAPPARIRGTVEKFAGHDLTVKTRDGGLVTVTLAPDFTVRSVVRERLADLKPGEMAGFTSVKGPGGAQQAIEVHIFPKDMPNVRVGQFPWDLKPESLMTNATVAQISASPQGRVVKVTYQGKETEITVPPGVPVVAFAPGDPSLLKPGAAVFVIARKQPDGSLTAPGVTAEKNGVKPPM
jgi:hypothetical protein